jgi:hypothetical protein
MNPGDPATQAEADIDFRPGLLPGERHGRRHPERV